MVVRRGECAVRVGIAMVDAAKSAKANQALHEELEDRQAAVSARVETESGQQENVRRNFYDEVLVPFREVFVKLKNVDLAELGASTLPRGAELPRVEMQAVRSSAFGVVGALAGGVVSGVGAGAGAFSAVGAFAAASTGTPMAALSGAAATKATLAFLGGGSLAAGGGGVAAGTLVLGGLVAAPVVVAGLGYVAWRGRAALRVQQEIALALREGEADLAAAEARTAVVLGRSRQTRAVLDDLRAETAARLPGLVELVDRNTDYATYTPVQCTQVAALVGLVTTAVAVMSTPLADGAGSVTQLSEQVLSDARRRLDDLGAEQGAAA